MIWRWLAARVPQGLAVACAARVLTARTPAILAEVRVGEAPAGAAAAETVIGALRDAVHSGRLRGPISMRDVRALAASAPQPTEENRAVSAAEWADRLVHDWASRNRVETPGLPDLVATVHAALRKAAQRGAA